MDIALIGNWNETRATHGLAEHGLVPPAMAAKSPHEVYREHFDRHGREMDRVKALSREAAGEAKAARKRFKKWKKRSG